MLSKKKIRWLALIALSFAFIVVMLGAYTRLTNAGLGCPDWPGCYGHLVPVTSIEPAKAWTEMIHRYAAGTLAGCILFFAMASLRLQPRFRLIPWILVATVVFQALLGMWTVTLKLLPMVVMGHLLGGLTILALLCYWCWQLQDEPPLKKNFLLLFSVLLGLVFVFFQIILGGWVSANYAGIACIGFPKCNGYWIPPLRWEVATFQWVHRMGAWFLVSYISILMGILIKFATCQRLRFVAALTLLLVLTQFMLGIINVVYLLPLGAAVLHNGIAAALLASMVSVWYCVRH